MVSPLFVAGILVNLLYLDGPFSTAISYFDGMLPVGVVEMFNYLDILDITKLTEIRIIFREYSKHLGPQNLII